MSDEEGGTSREVREYTWQAMVPVSTSYPADGERRSESLLSALRKYEPRGSVKVWDGGASFIFPVTGEGEVGARRYALMLVASTLFDVGLHAHTAEILDHKMDLILQS